MFTLAHTITLALTILGYIALPDSIVEPLIAASIIYIGIENIITQEIHWHRIIVIFLFGLPVCYHAARSGLDIDLLTRGAGFGYIGSTISSLIRARVGGSASLARRES